LVFSTAGLEGCGGEETDAPKEDAKRSETSSQSTTRSQAGRQPDSAIAGTPSEGWPYIEAEDATEVHPPMEVERDSNASGGKYVASRGKAGWVRFDIDVPEDGVYIIWGNTFAKDRKSDSFHVGVNVDERQTEIWDFPVGGWQWSKVKGRTGRRGPLTFELARGKNSITFWHREADAQLDQIFLTTDPDATP